MHSPLPQQFTHKLSWDEQLALSPADAEAYTDWFVRNVMERPMRRKVSEDQYLDGDYSRVGSMQATDWGE
jgi:hypothetical protein